LGEIINLELIKEHKEKEGTLEVVKESLDIALNYYSVEGDHYKAQILLNILNNWDQFFNEEKH